MIAEEIKYRVGKMTKAPRQMSKVELQNWQEQGTKEIRAYLFSINQPLVYYKDDVLVVEHKNGVIEQLK